MDHALAQIRVNATRLRSRFDTLAAIGATPNGGVCRLALSAAHREARAWFIAEAQNAGLEPHVDGAGNHSATLASGPPDGRTLVLGSHLDSVADGGRFDGALGVVAALEILDVVRELGLRLRTHLEAIDFTDEEGTFVGLMGSQAVAGLLDAERLSRPAADPTRFAEALAAAGLTRASVLSARRDPNTIAGYLELHVEQGTRLLAAGADVGIVTGIVGMRSFRVTLEGRPDHAGTTAMGNRRDAGRGAAAFILAVPDLVTRDFPDAVANIGSVTLEPGALNVVPGRAEMGLQFRAADVATLEALEGALLSLARRVAHERDLRLVTSPLERVDPAGLDERVQQGLAAAADRLGLAQIRLPSGAGHDAQSMAVICPAGMIFVPSVGGASHAPDELTTWTDCLNGANVLLQAALAGLLDR